MPVAAFKDIPGIIEDLVTRRRQGVTFGLPHDMLRQSQRIPLSIKYVLAAATDSPNPDPLIKPISHLKQENTSTVVLACGEFSMEATAEAVTPYGDFTVINAFTLDYTGVFGPPLLNLPLAYKRTKKLSTARRGILVRGASMGEHGFQALQKLAADHPNDYIVVSVWDTTSEKDKEKLESVCDRLILNQIPKTPGQQTCNLQLAVIQPGIKALLEAGVERILIVRTDYLFCNRFMLDGFDAMLDAFPSDVAKSYGQKGRLIVTDLGTRHYLPYHLGDMLTYGFAEDVMRFWYALKEDTRTFSKATYGEMAHKSMMYVGQTCPVNEIYFATTFMQSIGRPAEWTIADSLSFCRDFFIVVSYIDAGMFWFKKMWYDQVSFLKPPGQYITQQTWTALASGRAVEDFIDLDATAISWDDFISVIAV